MTTPVLSLIIPNHNHTEHLPGLFDSILAQSFKELEIILVDDCSDSSCAPLAQAYRNKGLPVSLLEHQRRVYILQARLAGIRASKGRIIAFADADDLIPGGDAMERNVAMFLQHAPDILHFRFSIIDQSDQFVAYADLPADPRAQFASGENVFSLFAQSSLYHTAPIWNKYYSCNLCNVLINEEHPPSLTSYSNDLYFNSLLFYAAKKYVGSGIVGYSYRHNPDDAHISKAIGRAAACYKIMSFMDAYLEKRNCNEIDKERYRQSCLREIALEAGAFCRVFHENADLKQQRAILDTLLTHADMRSWLEILLIGNGYNASKIRKIYKEFR